MTAAKKNSTVLTTLGYPLYSIQLLTSRHILIGGGGGASNTGILNGFEILEIVFDGKTFEAKKLYSEDTGQNVIMNSSISRTEDSIYLAVGRESRCQIYQLQFAFQEPNQTNNCDNTNEKTLSFKAQIKNSMQTDFNEAETPLQRVVRFNKSGDMLATGGTDGHVKVWTFPELISVCNFTSHTKEIDDVDFDNDSSRLVSVAKDGACFIWDLETQSKKTELKWDTSGFKYMYKKCKFSYNEKNKTTLLFTVSNPATRFKQCKSHLQQWNAGDKFTLNKCCKHSEFLSALAVRNDGKYVCVGTMFTGSILVFDAITLTAMQTIKSAHTAFITGLEFVPTSNDLSDSLTTYADAVVLSISIDKKVIAHSVYRRSFIALWILIIAMIAMMCALLFRF